MVRVLSTKSVIIEYFRNGPDFGLGRQLQRLPTENTALDLRGRANHEFGEDLLLAKQGTFPGSLRTRKPEGLEASLDLRKATRRPGVLIRNLALLPEAQRLRLRPLQVKIAVLEERERAQATSRWGGQFEAALLPLALALGRLGHKRPDRAACGLGPPGEALAGGGGSDVDARRLRHSVLVRGDVPDARSTALFGSVTELRDGRDVVLGLGLGALGLVRRAGRDGAVVLRVEVLEVEQRHLGCGRGRRERNTELPIESRDEGDKRVARARPVVTLRRRRERLRSEGPCRYWAFAVGLGHGRGRAKELLVLVDNVEVGTGVGNELALVAVDRIAAVALLDRVRSGLAKLALKNAVDLIAPNGQRVDTVLAKRETGNNSVSGDFKRTAITTYLGRLKWLRRWFDVFLSLGAVFLCCSSGVDWPSGDEKSVE